MEAVLKTREVSEQLGVNPTTIQRWVKHFNIGCQLNEQGHYLFSMPQVEVLHEIKGQLNSGKRLKDIQLNQKIDSTNGFEKNGIPTSTYEQELGSLMNRIDILEGKLSQKADEVVSYQIACQRREINDMMTMLKAMEEKIKKIEANSSDSKEKVVSFETIEKKPKKRPFIKMFSL